MSTLPSLRGRTLPQQRLEWLCDAGSLEAITPSSPDINVIAARGRVDSQPVVCYAQDSSIAGGSVGLDEAELIVRVLRHSYQARVPVVGFLESAGARLQDGTGALAEDRQARPRRRGDLRRARRHRRAPAQRRLRFRGG